LLFGVVFNDVYSRLHFTRFIHSLRRLKKTQNCHSNNELFFIHSFYNVTSKISIISNLGPSDNLGPMSLGPRLKRHGLIHILGFKRVGLKEIKIPSPLAQKSAPNWLKLLAPKLKKDFLKSERRS
jgi:hypothetical protein